MTLRLALRLEAPQRGRLQGRAVLLQRVAVKLNHNTVSTLALAPEVFSEEKYVLPVGGSITVQTAIDKPYFCWSYFVSLHFAYDQDWAVGVSND